MWDYVNAKPNRQRHPNEKTEDLDENANRQFRTPNTQLSTPSLRTNRKNVGFRYVITSFNQNLPPELIRPMLYVSRTVFHPGYDELDSSICRCWWREESLLSWIYKVNIIAVTIRFLDPSLFGRLIAQPNLQRTRPKRKGNKDAEPSVYPLAKVENLFDFSIAKEKGRT